jgi:hypothetical protein
LREIEVGEFTEVFESDSVVSLGSFYLVSEIPDVYTLSIKPNIDLPSFALFVPSYASVSCRVVLHYPSTGPILAVCTLDQIASPIVERIVISMMMHGQGHIVKYDMMHLG